MPVISLMVSVAMTEPMARCHSGWWSLWIEIAIGWALALPENRNLAVESENRARNVWLAKNRGCVIHKVASCKVVGAIKNQVVLGKDFENVVVVES
jgi:hypothetical protein